MNDLKSSTTGYLKTLQVLHLALVAGIVIFIIAAVITIKMEISAYPQLKIDRLTLIVIMLVIAIAGGYTGKIIFDKRLEQIEKEQNIYTKLQDYRPALIIKYVLFDVPSMIGIVVFILTKEYIILFVVGALLFFLILYRPTKESIAAHLKLNNAEQLFNEL